MIDKVLSKKLKSLITIRVIFVTLLLGSFFILQVGYRDFPHPRSTLNLIIALYTLTIVYAILLKRVKMYALFAYVQLFIDASAVNMLIYLTGGIESWFSFIMPLTVMSAGTVLNKRAGYIIATFNSILYGIIIDLQYYRVLPLEYDTTLTEKAFLYNIFAHISAFYLVAFLSGYLSSRLEKTSQALEQTDSDLRDLELFNEEIIENIPSGIFTTDIKGRILIFNRAAEDITGIGRKIALRQKIDGIFPFINPPIPPLPKGGERELETMEGVISHRKEGDRIIHLTVSELRDITEKSRGFVGIFQDITQLKKMEAEIKHKEKWAAIGELSANIAHEIRNPIASLKGSVEMLRENIVTEEHKKRLTEIALKEMDRLNNIISDFLTYSSPRPAEFHTFDLNLMLDDTLELLAHTASVRENLTITKNFNGPLFVSADQQKLRQVFWNLGMNAIEAMPSGGELSVNSRESDDFAEIIFRDTGAGIPRENLGKIFYPFFTTKDEGTGLGLAIAYRIIEEHNGKINITSNNNGTTFKVIIPNVNGKA